MQKSAQKRINQQMHYKTINMNQIINKHQKHHNYKADINFFFRFILMTCFNVAFLFELIKKRMQQSAAYLTFHKPLIFWIII
jgi:hypothetical protein